MGLAGEFTKGAGPVAMEGFALAGGDAEMHRYAAGADAFDGVMDRELARFADRFAKTGFESVHHHVNILVAVGVEIGDPEEVLKEGLLGALKVEEIAGMMEDAEGVEFIKINGGGMGIGSGHDKRTECRGGTYEVRRTGIEAWKLIINRAEATGLSLFTHKQSGRIAASTGYCSSVVNPLRPIKSKSKIKRKRKTKTQRNPNEQPITYNALPMRGWELVLRAGLEPACP